MTTEGIYNFAGVDLLLPPTNHGWRDRKVIGYDGYNLAIYEPTYSFQMSWDIQQPSEYSQIWEFWKDTSAAGSVTVYIPQKGAPTYIFASYAGCVIDEPTMREYFVKHQLKIELLIRNITVDLS